MKKFVLATTLAAGCTLASINAPTASAQSAVLSETFGRGVHSYFAGDHQGAYLELSAAINGGLADPLAYYFRGMAATASGRAYEAESDWEMGAELEAQGKIGQPIGRALTRFQGHERLKLEEIRRKVKLRYLAQAKARSEMRYGEIEAARVDVVRPAPAPIVPGVTPPPAPTIAAPADDPFAANAVGEPEVDSDDALKGALENPFKDEANAMASGDAPTGDSPAGGDPFGGDPKSADPFGGDAGADPFGGGDTGMDSADPFGGGGDSDPFGGDPFN